MAFGDAENDLPMIKAVKNSYCMKQVFSSPLPPICFIVLIHSSLLANNQTQGADALKQIAQFVTEFTNDEDGVARELQKLFPLSL